jgi:hypothetical protein
MLQWAVLYLGRPRTPRSRAASRLILTRADDYVGAKEAEMDVTREEFLRHTAHAATIGVELNETFVVTVYYDKEGNDIGQVWLDHDRLDLIFTTREPGEVEGHGDEIRRSTINPGSRLDIQTGRAAL